MAQRARLASASVLDVDDILVAIVQYSASPKDVVALLRAMPLSVRTPALTALLGLVTLPRGAKHWPQPYLNSTTIAEIDCISAAMPVFNSVCIDGVCCSTQWPANDDPAFRLPYCKFVVTHAAKMTMVDLRDLRYPVHREELCRMLARCTNLRRVRIPAEPDLLEAVTSPAHCVADLDLSPPTGSDGLAPSAIAALERWLASGHACHVTFRNFGAFRDATLAAALSSSSTLAGLCVSWSDGLLRSLVAHGGALTSLDALDIESLGGDHVAHLVSLLHMPHMKSLAISNVEYVHLGGALLSKLPQLTALEHLRLERTELHETNCALSTTSCLRSVHLDSVDLSTQSFEAVLLFALGSDRLEAITWKRCSILGASVECVADTILLCITEQVPKIAMKACGIRAPSLHALAERLCMLKADVPTEINLARNALTLVSTRALVEAVATCQKVTIVLSADCKPFLLAKHGHMTAARKAGVTIQRRGQSFFLCSPRVPSTLA